MKPGNYAAMDACGYIRLTVVSKGNYESKVYDIHIVSMAPHISSLSCRSFKTTVSICAYSHALETMLVVMRILTTIIIPASSVCNSFVVTFVDYNVVLHRK